MDTGNQERRLRQALGRQGVVQLDAVFITHGDDDHSGLLSQLETMVPVRSIGVPAPTVECSCDQCVDVMGTLSSMKAEGRLSLHVGDRLAIGNFKLDVVAPETFVDRGGNADSLVLLLSYDRMDGLLPLYALLTGDAEGDVLGELVQRGLIPTPIAAFKVGHHGSAQSVNEPLLASLRPSVALISVGADNRFGHPNDQVLEDLQESGTAIHRTDLEGDINVVFSDQGLRVSTQSGGGLGDIE